MAEETGKTLLTYIGAEGARLFQERTFIPALHEHLGALSRLVGATTVPLILTMLEDYGLNDIQVDPATRRTIAEFEEPIEMNIDLQLILGIAEAFTRTRIGVFDRYIALVQRGGGTIEEINLLELQLKALTGIEHIVRHNMLQQLQIEPVPTIAVDSQAILSAGEMEWINHYATKEDDMITTVPQAKRVLETEAQINEVLTLGMPIGAFLKQRRNELGIPTRIMLEELVKAGIARPDQKAFIYVYEGSESKTMGGRKLSAILHILYNNNPHIQQFILNAREGRRGHPIGTGTRPPRLKPQDINGLIQDIASQDEDNED